MLYIPGYSLGRVFRIPVSGLSRFVVVPRFADMVENNLDLIPF